MRNVLLTATKTMTLDDYPESAWLQLAGGTGGAANYFRAVPWLYRAVEIRAQAVGSMPFAIYRGETEIDTSRDYQNKVTFLPNPRALLWLVEACLTLEPAAYLFSDNAGRLRKRLRYILPNGVTPVIDPVKGLTSFRRYVNSQMREFLPGVDVVYFWRPDPYVEQGAGAGRTSPARAALAAAGVLANIDEFIAGYFAHGAVKATILGVKGSPSREEVTKLEAWWKQFVGGVKNAWGGKVVNSEAVTPTVIGEGLESLGNNTLTNERREDIATALGVPHSLLFSNAANFATAQQDDLHFYSKTIVPECELIAGVLNEQVFEPLGYRLAFQPETLDAFQEDTQQQATALQALTSAGFPLLMAADLVGIELTEQQRAELEAAEREKEARAEEVARQMQPNPTQPETEQAQEETPTQADTRRWMAKALKAVKRGEAASVPFESESIPAVEQERIHAGLATAVTADAVRAVFASASAGESQKSTTRDKREPGRTQKLKSEALLAAAVQKRFQAQARHIRARLGEEYADRKMIGGYDLTDDDESAAEIMLVILSAMKEGVNLFSRRINLTLDFTGINLRALEQAKKYAYDLVRGIDDTTRKVLQGVISAFVETPGMTIGDVMEQLPFDEQRAMRIAVTETTRAYADGNRLAAQELKEQWPDVKVVRQWFTNNDDLVCPVCGDLDGKEVDGDADFEEGIADPPAHPNCRCWTDYRTRING